MHQQLQQQLRGVGTCYHIEAQQLGDVLCKGPELVVVEGPRGQVHRSAWAWSAARILGWQWPMFTAE